MSVYDFLFILVIAAGAFYAGYQTGRASVFTQGRGADASPPTDNPLPGPSPNPTRSRGEQTDGAGTQAAAPGAMPRRTTKPPPAAAGLLDKGSKD